MRITEHTKFVFITLSAHPDDHDKYRFMLDVLNCIVVLVNKGVTHTNISIITDWEKGEWPLPVDVMSYFEFIKPVDAYTHIEQLRCENLFVVSSCHGGLLGIGCKHLIRPYNLTESFKNNTHIKNVVTLFGQCYAGVFHYSDISTCCDGKNIVYIGATGMRSGLSTLHKGSAGLQTSWIANISVYYFAEWFNKPVDVDNDGHLSVMDLYKYISYKTNNITERVEKAEVMRFLNKKIQVEIKKQRDSDQSFVDRLDIEANEALAQYIIPHQDCWILNAMPASKMYLE